MSIGRTGKVIFGETFGATCAFKLTSYHSIEFSQNVLFGWDCMVMDTDFHALTKLKGGHAKGYAPIKIGKYNWFGNGCKIMKRTETPDYCTFQARTIINSKCDFPPYSVIGTDTQLIQKAEGVYRNPEDDKVEYQFY